MLSRITVSDLGEKQDAWVCIELDEDGDLCTVGLGLRDLLRAAAEVVDALATACEYSPQSRTITITPGDAL